MTDNSPKRRPRNWRSFDGSLNERASIALSRLEDITRLVSEWVWEADSDGCFTYLSDRVLEALGFHPMQLIGKGFKDLGEFKNLKQNATEPNWQKPFRHFEFVAKHKDGEERVFHVSGLPIFNPETWKFDGVCGICEDVTDRLKKEETLKKAFEEVRLANRAKTNFLANMSHELRTPLNAIIGFSDAMLTGALGQMDAEQVHTYTGHIKHAGDQLLRLIDDILDVAAIEENEISLREEPVDLHDVFETVSMMMSHRAIDNGITLSFEISDDLPLIRADSLRIKQIMLNLISNALKFTQRNGTVQCKAIIDLHDSVRITIEDTGIGMSKAEIDVALVAFAQVESPFSANNDGSGLGIPLTKGLVEAHGGYLSYASEKGKGTKVEVTLPPSRTVPIESVG
ncbi:MAG: ATP-binding protein [Alphaproteobacteria bacterium]|nr:ATP-binding protein [Rhodospirillales bacterium]MCW9044936.1 ATP-binding protein [Alphaproteobacteria bacterium]